MIGMSFPVLGRLRGFRALGVRLYVEGLSLRRVAEILCELGFQVSHESVRDWFHISSWFTGLKRGIKQFNTYFPTYSPKVSEKWIRSWMTLS
ncbi:MAG: hypothetical protein QXN23_06530 [Candidatus Caldarchaeum sp.]